MKTFAALCLVLLSSCASTPPQERELREVAVFTRPQLVQAVKEQSHLSVNGQKKLSREEIRSLIDAMDGAKRLKGRILSQREGNVLLTCGPERCAVNVIVH